MTRRDRQAEPRGSKRPPPISVPVSVPVSAMVRRIGQRVGAAGLLAGLLSGLLVVGGCAGRAPVADDTGPTPAPSPEPVATTPETGGFAPLFRPGPRVERFDATDRDGPAPGVRRTVSGVGADGRWTIEIERLDGSDDSGASAGWSLDRRLGLVQTADGPVLESLGSVDARSGAWVEYVFEPGLAVERDGASAAVFEGASGKRAGSAVVSFTPGADVRAWSLLMRLGPARVERTRRALGNGTEETSLRVSVFGITARAVEETWTPRGREGSGTSGVPGDGRGG